MSSTDLSIQTTQPQEEDETSLGMPLSPASVRSYQKNKAQKTKKKSPKGEQPFSEDDSEEDEEDEEASYESDKKSDEDEDDDEFDASHLDPRLEALDGTTKLKSAAEKEQEEEEDEEEQDSSNEEDADSAEVSALGDAVSDLKLGVDVRDSASSVGKAGASDMSSITPSLVITPGNTIFEGEVYQDPTSLGATSFSNLGQEERLQEPVKPHIALPCLVETAKNPARTRITLKYSGSDHATLATSEAQEQKTSTRGRKNYMVATDLSGESWHATEWAITTILRNGDELNVVTIVEDEKSDSKAIKKGVQTEMREDAEKLTKNIHEQLEHTCLKDITVVIHIIAATKSMGAKDLLIEMIDDLEDLSTVIVGSRGRGAIKGLLLGSISNYLVHNSSVPVMVVRAPKKSKGKKKARRGRIVEQTRSVREANLKYEQAFAEDS
ncbi:hypothetical protein BGX28_005116 [Mortierella sp. GBA30]|nr:hypothetical protein BGX28_005116 [Mortierella sp. GBA30]